MNWRKEVWLWENAEFAQKVSEEKKPVLIVWDVVRHFAKLCVAASSTGKQIIKEVHKNFNIIPDT